MKPHHLFRQRIATRLGTLTAARSAAGVSGLWFDGQRHHPGEGLADVPLVTGDPLLSEVDAALQCYLEGEALPAALLRRMDPQGTDFQRAVWRALLAIAPGESRTYGGLAAQLGRPAAVRALGAAVGRNPVSILIPCHRVLGVAGQLTGYAGGLDRKIALLRLEGARFQPHRA